MRKLIIILTILLISAKCFCTNYYVSNAGSDLNVGTSASFPWRTLSKVNAATFANGDAVYFKRGDSWYGSLIVNKNNVTFSAYSTGAKPIISGFTTLSGWINTGTNKYYTTVNADSTLNVLTIDGVLQRQARTPNYDSANAGYRTFYSVDSTATNKIRNTFGLSVGDLIVVRQNDWRIVKVKVTAVNNDTVIFAKIFDLANGSLSALEANKFGFGWFKVNDTASLDQQGEWTYNYTTKRLYIYSTVDPSGLTIKAATVDTLINIGTHKYNTVSNIRFEGGNLYGAYALQCENVLIDNCEFEYMTQAIGGQRLYNSVISNNSIKNILQIGVYVQSLTSPFPDVTITGNTIDSVGLMAGMGSMNQSNDYAGISANVSNILNVSYNYISNTGREGISWQGSNVNIIYNSLSNYCKVGQDRGAIYSYWDQTNNGNNVYFRNRRVAHNFISEGIGAAAGTPTPTVVRASGVYMDGISGYANIDSNTIWNYPRSGVNLNIDSAINVRGNTFVPGDNSLYPSARVVGVQQQGLNLIKNFAFTNNISYLSAATQSNIYYTIPNLNGSTVGANVSAIGTIENNYLNYVLSPVWKIESYTSPGAGFALSSNTFLQWQGLSGYDLLSTNLLISGNTQLLTNAEPNTKNFYLGAKYKDAYGNVYQRTIALQPYSSLFLIYFAPLEDVNTNIIHGVKFVNQ